MNTPRTNEALAALLERDGKLSEDNAPAVLVKLCKELESERDEAVDIARKVMETVMQIYGHAQFCDECQSFEIADSCRIQMHGMDRINSLVNADSIRAEIGL